MSAPAKIDAPPSPDYWEDGYGWALAQAAMMRAGAVDRLDWNNIIEEIESVGSNEYNALESALRVLLIHMLKWDHQPGLRSRSWYLTIREQHRQYRRRLDKNPSLKPRLDEIRDEAYRQARVAAQAETGLAIDVFPADAPGWNAIENPVASLDDLPQR